MVEHNQFDMYLNLNIVCSCIYMLAMETNQVLSLPEHAIHVLWDFGLREAIWWPVTVMTIIICLRQALHCFTQKNTKEERYERIYCDPSANNYLEVAKHFLPVSSAFVVSLWSNLAIS